MTPEERIAYIKGLRAGFELAQNCAWVSAWNGWSVTAPIIDWGEAEKRLAEAVTAAEAHNEDGS